MIDVDCDFPPNASATIDAAMMTYMLSTYYKEKKEKGVTGKIRISVPQGDNNVVWDFYNLRNVTLGNTDQKIVTDTDAIHAAILWNNMLVKGMRAQGMAGMHPLSRVAASEENIKGLRDYFQDRQVMAWASVDSCVKLFNTACSRKPYQFSGVTQYIIVLN